MRPYCGKGAKILAKNGYNHVDPETGNVTYRGTSELTKGNHNNMPSRTDAYLSTDERGHIQASSLGGSNKSDNVVAQSADLNHGGYYQMEEGERAALKNGATIESEKIAYVNGQPGDRPSAFMVNDTITYADGQTQTVNLSFANMTNAEQEALNAESIAYASELMDETPNPGDSLRASMSSAEYAQLMEETDAALPGVADMYDQHSTAGSPSAASDNAASAQWDFDTSGLMDAQMGEEGADPVSADADSADLGGTDDGADPSADDD